MESIAETLLNVFEEKIPNYYQTEIIRTSQVQMAMDIAAFLDKNEPKKFLVIEAPVGTGKSLGALIPSMLNSKIDTNHRVVYATATINLQSQLMNSEVPLLEKISLLKSPILAMGKIHYYCHKRFKFKYEQFSRKERDKFIEFFKNAETGQRNEFEGKFQQNISDNKWSKVELKASKMFLASRKCMKWQLKMHTYTCQIPWLTLRD